MRIYLIFISSVFVELLYSFCTMYLYNVDVLFVQQGVLIEQVGPSMFLFASAFVFVCECICILYLYVFIYSADEKQEPLWAV